MEALLKYGQVGLTFLLVMTVLVGVHEYGHYIAARLFGMRVKAFAIMMGGVRDRSFDRESGGKLEPVWPVWSMGVIGAALTTVGGLERVPNLFYVGMVMMAFALPIWVTARLGRLYRQNLRDTISPLVTGYGIFMVVALFALRGQGTPNNYLALAFFGGWIGVLFAYYKPVLGKEPEQNMGEGEVTTETGHKLPVRFRPIIARKDKRGTEFSMLALPLGGFCAIAGMNPETEQEERDGFYAKAAWKRFLVLFAGPLFSLLLGVVLLTILVKSNGLPDGRTFVLSFSADSKAAAAGLRPDDQILRVNGKPIESFGDMRSAIAATPKDQDAQVEYSRDGQTATLSVPTYLSPMEEPEVTPTGLATGKMVHPRVLGLMLRFGSRPAGWGESAVTAVKIPGAMVAGLFNLAKQPTLVTKNVGGAASMVAATKEATDEGWRGILRMAGLLSMSLGVMNLLPIQPLDGGQMMVALYEMIRGKRMSPRALGVVTSIGLVLILMLMFTVLVADVTRFTGG
ncbi:MAG: site-2 protease family protein [Chthonomonas sp.]|nr:site-2 protease family protein [Chthonomonas sp.]